MEAIGRTGWRTVKMRQKRVMLIDFTQHALRTDVNKLAVH